MWSRRTKKGRLARRSLLRSESETGFRSSVNIVEPILAQRITSMAVAFVLSTGLPKNTAQVEC